ncbi:MAG: hypothetical protein KGJ62_00835 [Armatimonadetes bacterium]|nr:hypothetical protein [Armatimonadota bacterium]MDE2205111.1 hypothetical protein [Armatimonadota bacterium]
MRTINRILLAAVAVSAIAGLAGCQTGPSMSKSDLSAIKAGPPKGGIPASAQAFLQQQAAKAAAKRQGEANSKWMGGTPEPTPGGSAPH